jgi:hypothetical protein
MTQSAVSTTTQEDGYQVSRGHANLEEETQEDRAEDVVEENAGDSDKWNPYIYIIYSPLTFWLKPYSRSKARSKIPQDVISGNTILLYEHPKTPPYDRQVNSEIASNPQWILASCDNDTCSPPSLEDIKENIPCRQCIIETARKNTPAEKFVSQVTRRGRCSLYVDALQSISRSHRVTDRSIHDAELPEGFPSDEEALRMLIQAEARKPQITMNTGGDYVYGSLISSSHRVETEKIYTVSRSDDSRSDDHGRCDSWLRDPSEVRDVTRGDATHLKQMIARNQ